MAATELTTEAFRTAIAASKPVLVDFWAPWCTYCRRIAPAYEKLAEQYQDRLLVGKVNIDEAPELAREYGVEVIPTLTLYRQGQPVASVVAPESKAQIEAFIQEHLE